MQNAMELAPLFLEVDLGEVSAILEQSHWLGIRMSNLLNAFTMPLETPDINIVDHIRGIAEESERTHKNLRMEINSEKDVEKKVFTANRLLPLVWTNIFRNATQYAGSNPLVTVDISLYKQNFEIRITNNGPGISPEKREMLFIRDSNSGIDERGMGLYLSRVILGSQGGSIELFDGPETQFIIRIPFTYEIEE
ncbi:MAG: ATP-binding protein [Candidatus Thorarchaeota archaeon]|nr:ATP-binding protein [Candidatus Thorarchaeota archaeon]